MLFFNRFRAARRRSERLSLRERGAAALEFALISPVFFLVVFGGFEIGFMFRNNLALQDTARSAVRVASVQRNAPDADLEIIRKVNNRVGDLNGDVEWIVIFAADTLNSEVPPECTGSTPGGPSSSQTHKCNVYRVTNGDVQSLVDNFVAENGIPDADRGAWDNIGVYVEYDYQYVTGFFDSITLSSSSVAAIELDV